jgi:multiple sugar transport system ATP-binding protein
LASIDLAGVHKTYPNGAHAVSDLSLHVDDGEFMVLVGPSGCGKTTALRMVAGLEEISAGTVKVGDRVVNDLSPRDRDIAMVFQNYALYPHMTVRENIGFALRLRRRSGEEIRTKVAEAAAILGLTEYLDRRPAQLSGGQRQRVAMGRAIVREPAAFLMDEPLSNLDAKLRVAMRAEVSKVQSRLGVATLYVTHDQTEAMTMGDRVAVLRAGTLQQLDAPQALYDRPANQFVAAFIGSPPMNLYQGSLSEDGESVRLGSQTLSLPAWLRGSAAARYRGGPVTVGFRPEHLRMAGAAGSAADAPDTGRLAGEVELVEALGSEKLVHFRTEAERVHETDAAPTDRAEDGGALSAGEIGGTLASTGVARVAPDVPVKVGDRVEFAVDTDHLALFDPADGVVIG